MSIDTLNAFAAEFEDQKKAFLAKAKEQLQPALLSVFEKHPEVKAFGWNQYTPYFNDGETCEFSVNDLYATVDEDEVEENFYEWKAGEVYGDAEDGFTAEAWDTLKALGSTLSSNEDLLLSVFGDHVKVIVTPEGVSVDEYSHD